MRARSVGGSEDRISALDRLPEGKLGDCCAKAFGFTHGLGLDRSAFGAGDLVAIPVLSGCRAFEEEDQERVGILPDAADEFPSMVDRFEDAVDGPSSRLLLQALDG